MDRGSEAYRRYLEGDDEGMALLVREYKDGLILYLNSFVGNLYTAEDLAEDTFVRLGVRRPRDNGKSSFRTWLYAIGRNLAIDWLRKNRRRQELSLEEAETMAADADSLEAAYLKQERKIALHRTMAQLKPEHRQVLWLVYFEGFSYEEAARVMGRSRHSLETLAYRARKALKEALELEGIRDVEER